MRTYDTQQSLSITFYVKVIDKARRCACVIIKRHRIDCPGGAAKRDAAIAVNPEALGFEAGSRVHRAAKALADMFDEADDD